MKYLSLCILIMATLPSCLAIGPVTTNVSKTEVPDKYLKCLDPKDVGNMKSCSESKVHELSIDHVISLWGEPNLIIKKGELTLYKYDNGLAWRGLFGIVVVIPIPLLIPVGYNETTLSFKNNQLVSIEAESGEANGNMAVCGLHSSGPNGFGCRTGW